MTSSLPSTSMVATFFLALSRQRQTVPRETIIFWAASSCVSP